MKDAGSICLVLFLLVAAARPSIGGVTINVSNETSTISTALAGASSGDEIVVQPGLYTGERLTSFLYSVSIRLLDGQTIIRGVGNVIPGEACVWLTLQGQNNLALLGPGELVIEGCGMLTLQANSSFTQNTSLRLINATIGMALGESAIWEQTGALTITSSADASLYDTLVSLEPSARWMQSAPVRITSTGPIAVMLNSSTWIQQAKTNLQLSHCGGVHLYGLATWVQQSAGEFNANCDNATGVSFVTAGSTWQQDGSASFNTSENGIGVHFEAEGTWYQTGQANFHVENATIGVSFNRAGSWLQSGSIEMNVTGGRGVLFHGQNGLWTQTDMTSTSVTCSNYGVGVVMEGGGDWVQRTVLGLTLDSCTGVFVQGGNWTNEGQLTATMVTNIAPVVSISAGGTWDQRARVIIREATQASNGSSEAGVLFTSCNASFPCKWLQRGALEATTSSLGVVLSDGSTWEQRSPVALTVGLKAVHVEQGGVWEQRSQAILRVNTNPPLFGYGVHLEGGKWRSTRDGNTTIVVSSGVGVNVVSGTIQQDGRLDINITGSTALSQARCAGVSFEEARGLHLWNQNQTTTIRVSDGAGVLLSSSALWQQFGRMAITIQGNATGLDMSNGGAWYLRNNLNINTVAQGSSTALTKGFVCGQLRTCCSQVQDTTSVTFSAAGAASRDDCPLPSPSSTPAVVAPTRVVNTTATFSNSTPSVSVGGSTTSDTNSDNSNNNGQAEVGVTLSLTNVIAPSGGEAGNGSSVTPTTYSARQVNGSSDGSNNKSNETTWVYEAPLDNSTSLAQTFTFHRQESTASFVGTEFAVGAGTVKWSLNFTSSSSSSSSSDNSTTASPGFTLQYDLVALLSQATNNGLGISGGAEVIRKSDTPKRDMTTYLVRLATTDNSTSATSSGGVVVAVEVFDVVLVDGLYARLTHNLVVVNSTITNGNGSGSAVAVKTQSQLRLELELPAFKQSLEYDPSLSLGVLLSGSTRAGGSGGSDDNTALIVATAVAIPVAVALVVGVIIVASIVLWRRREKRSELDLHHALTNSGEENL